MRCSTGAELAAGEGLQELNVCEDGERMVETADQVLAGLEIDAGFAADRRIDLGEQGRGYLNVIDSTHKDGGEEASDVADDPPAKGNEE